MSDRRLTSALHPSFRTLKYLSFTHSAIYTCLLIAWIAPGMHTAEYVLGWCHGIGWLALCAAVLVGCTRRVFPWPVLAATVSPLGPLGALIGIELTARQRRRRRVA